VSYATEFPDFHPDSLPAIPDSWNDVSWKNDCCPSWETPNGFLVYVDYEYVCDREAPTDGRYGVWTTDDCIYCGDDWSEVLRLVEKP
jgi:hypothetical protein